MTEMTNILALSVNDVMYGWALRASFHLMTSIGMFKTLMCVRVSSKKGILGLVIRLEIAITVQTLIHALGTLTLMSALGLLIQHLLTQIGHQTC